MPIDNAFNWRYNGGCKSYNRQSKILILGYKEYGFGINYYLKNKTIDDNKYTWFTRVPKTFGLGDLILSFDNLAISQLKLRRLFNDNDWATFYMEDDFKYTMYIDGVDGMFAKSSTSKQRVSFDDTTLLKYFQDK